MVVNDEIERAAGELERIVREELGAIRSQIPRMARR